MNILPLTLFISFILTINAQWHIKKNDQLKNGGYRNPGKRSIHDKKHDIPSIDCSKSFSQLNSYDEQMIWIFKCLRAKLPLQTHDNSISSESEDTQLDSTSRSKSFPIPSDDTEYISSFNRFLSKLRQNGINTRK